MVRSMYSGVSGLRSHQTRMDTIGNNIANVNTYGFKSGRTTFRDIYYQGMKSASEATAAQGGVNPSAVGYGSQVGSVDLMMSRSTFTMTDQTMDLAIDGEGFFQVQDGNGNTYYTRAGIINFDSAGNLVDMQGNYVLGVNGDPTGREPSSERIQVVLPNVPPTAASSVVSINGKEFTIAAANATKDGNLNINFAVDSKLADDEMTASISTSGIVIKMNPNNVYTSWDQFNAEMNAAITKANNNEPHPAGNITLSYTGDPSEDPFTMGPLTATNLTSTNYGIEKGNVKFGAGSVNKSGVTPSGVVGNTFGAAFNNDPPLVDMFTSKYDNLSDPDNPKWVFTMRIDGQDYVGEVDSKKTDSGKFKLYNTTTPDPEGNDYVEMSRPSFNKITDLWKAENGGDGKKETVTYTGPFTAQTLPGSISVLGQTVPLSAGVQQEVELDLSGVTLPVAGADIGRTVNILGKAITLAAGEAESDIATKLAAALGGGYTAAGTDGSGKVTVKAANVGEGNPAASWGTTDYGTVSDVTLGENAEDTTAAQLNAIRNYFNANSGTTGFEATIAGDKLIFTATTVGDKPIAAAAMMGVNPVTVDGVDAANLANGVGFDYDDTDLGNPTVKASGPSKSAGLSGSAFAMRKGTAGGPQTIADMTGLSIAPNGIITGYDAIGEYVIIGRIDLATFANPSGLNQAGSSNYTVSANSGEPKLNQPGSDGAGQLVSGSLEMSNVDLSREFSDMITTQRGYQANSRIITVTDTMLEELINLKR